MSPKSSIKSSSMLVEVTGSQRGILATSSRILRLDKFHGIAVEALCASVNCQTTYTNDLSGSKGNDRDKFLLVVYSVLNPEPLDKQVSHYNTKCTTIRRISEICNLKGRTQRASLDRRAQHVRFDHDVQVRGAQRRVGEQRNSWWDHPTPFVWFTTLPRPFDGIQNLEGRKELSSDYLRVQIEKEPGWTSDQIEIEPEFIGD